MRSRQPGRGERVGVARPSCPANGGKVRYPSRPVTFHPDTTSGRSPPAESARRQVRETARAWRDHLDAAVTSCRRGHPVERPDGRSGLRHRDSCPHVLGFVHSVVEDRCRLPFVGQRAASSGSPSVSGRHIEIRANENRSPSSQAVNGFAKTIPPARRGFGVVTRSTRNGSSSVGLMGSSMCDVFIE
jgi:hypothetical protein